MTKEEKAAIHHKYLDLKLDYLKYKSKAKNEYDFYNLIEKTVLEMEGEEPQSQSISDSDAKANGI